MYRSVRTEIIKAFIILSDEPEGNEELKKVKNLLDKIRETEVPKEIEFVKSLPMTTTGKIMRKELRNRELNSNLFSLTCGFYTEFLPKLL